VSKKDNIAKPAALGSLAKGFRNRTMVSAKLAGKIGLAYLGRKSNPGQGVRDETSLKSALKIVKELGALKGLAMKIGQIASYMPGALSPEAQAIFRELQTQSTPMTFESIRAVLESEFGAPISTLFDSFDPVPIAAASIGQVHRAVFEGRPVAVKVQYPGIEELMKSDLKSLRWISKLLVVGTPNDGERLAQELRDRMLEECDYRLEARRQTLFHQLYGKIAGAHIPSVIEARSTRRVLCSEYFEGMNFKEFCETANQEVKNRAATTIFNAVFQTLFRHAIYNGDPHPGNYLFTESGEVIFLDFGCVREFSMQFIDDWKRVEKAMLDNDRSSMRQHFAATGMMGVPAKDFDWDHHWETMRYVCRPYLEPQPFTFSQEYVQQSYKKILFDRTTMKMLKTPPEWLLLNRVTWGLNSVLGHLNATGPWGQYWLEGVTSKTEAIACP
jgi:predicted unusual protein kinase regulating ubiquinone biosynthesis (AarF/ABC1/UbiB family)